MDVSQLSDAELRDNLRSHGVSVGPIVASTRKVYEKKLLKLAGNQSSLHNDSSQINGHIDQNEKDRSFSPMFAAVTADTPSKRTTRHSGAVTQQPSGSPARRPDSDTDDECEESMRYLTEEEMAADRAALRAAQLENRKSSAFGMKQLLTILLVVMAGTFIYFLIQNGVADYIDPSYFALSNKTDDDLI
ncbi:hypothetical protein B9Z55_000007 [Caenorhabditis nigoni]|uniref:LEM domain-containing protein n=1 Tax=Caenorhabditis nigoni TaxID=1611254 RepID=A0A2G5VUD6_9PELO|nr:hypothetical protein B9Z55_000007 [Caenorhabditis nigoni]